MSNLTAPVDNTPESVDTKQPACHLVSAAPLALAGEQRDAPLPLRTIGRPDTLTAQRVEVAIVLHAMLGMSAATDYLIKHAVDSHVMQRVLNCTARRRGSHDVNGVRT